jgi:hypothetical protein
MAKWDQFSEICSWPFPAVPRRSASIHELTIEFVVCGSFLLHEFNFVSTTPTPPAIVGQPQMFSAPGPIYVQMSLQQIAAPSKKIHPQSCFTGAGGGAHPSSPPRSPLHAGRLRLCGHRPFGCLSSRGLRHLCL